MDPSQCARRHKVSTSFDLHLNCTISNALITIAIRLRYDYDPTTTYRARLLPFDAIRREQKNEHVNFSS